MPIEPHMTRKHAPAGWPASGRAFLAAVCAGGLVVGFAFAADPPTSRPAKGFKAPLDYFPPPHQLQVRSYLEGSESEMGPNGTVILHDAQLQTYREDGSREMTMSAPLCLYDYTKRVLNSTGALHVENWDDAHKRTLQVWGTNGFYWEQTNYFFVISNQQVTRISGASTNSIKP